MQEDLILTKVGKKFRGKNGNTKQYQGRHSVETPERLSERLRKTPAMLLESNTPTNSPPELNTSAGSSLGGCV